MSSLRDRIKSREVRVSESFQDIALKSGGARTQIVSSGLDLSVGTPTTTFSVSGGEAVNKQALRTIPAAANQAVDTGAATGAGQFRKVLVCISDAGAVTQVVGSTAGSQATAPTPAQPNGDVVVVGTIEVPASFTPGTTAVTAAMLKKAAYFGATA